MSSRAKRDNPGSGPIYPWDCDGYPASAGSRFCHAARKRLGMPNAGCYVCACADMLIGQAKHAYASVGMAPGLRVGRASHSPPRSCVFARRRSMGVPPMNSKSRARCPCYVRRAGRSPCEEHSGACTVIVPAPNHLRWMPPSGCRSRPEVQGFTFTCRPRRGPPPESGQCRTT